MISGIPKRKTPCGSLSACEQSLQERFRQWLGRGRLMVRMAVRMAAGSPEAQHLVHELEAGSKGTVLLLLQHQKHRQK